MCSTAYKKQGAPDHAVPLKTFYMCSTAYKKQVAPDRWSLTQQKLRLFTCVAPHIKSKGLLIGSPLLSKNLGFLYA
jgi:hypothetical protein